MSTEPHTGQTRQSGADLACSQDWTSCGSKVVPVVQLACCAEPTSLLLHQLRAGTQVLHACRLLRPGPGCCLAGSPPLLPGCQQQHPGVQSGLCWLLLQRPAALEPFPELQFCRAAALQAHDHSWACCRRCSILRWPCKASNVPLTSVQPLFAQYAGAAPAA